MFKKFNTWESAILLYLIVTLISSYILDLLGNTSGLSVYGFGIYSLLVSFGLFKDSQNYKGYNNRTLSVVAMLNLISLLVLIGLYGDLNNMLTFAICSQLYMLIPLIHNIFGMNSYSQIEKYLLDLPSEDLVKYEFLFETLPYLKNISFKELESLYRNIEVFGLNEYTENKFYELIDKGMNTHEMNNINTITNAFGKLK